MALTIEIRPARHGEADALSALCVRSKAHWGYDQDFMRLATSALQIEAAAVGEGRVLVAVDECDRPLGVAACRPLEDDGDFDLSHLFVEPCGLRRGIGRALFEAARAWCIERDGKRLAILSDPNAVAFYQRLGARLIGEAPSDAIPGRMLPRFEYRLAQRHAA